MLKALSESNYQSDSSGMPDTVNGHEQLGAQRLKEKGALVKKQTLDISLRMGEEKEIKPTLIDVCWVVFPPTVEQTLKAKG